MKKNLTYKESIRHFFLLYALIPLVILMIAVFVFIMILPRELVKAKTNENIRILSDRLFVMQKNYNEFAESFALSEELRDFYKFGTGLEKVTANFYDYNNKISVPGALHIMDTYGNISYSSKSLKNHSEQFIRIAMIPRLERSAGKTLYEYNKLVYQVPFTNSFCVSKAVMENDEILGYFLLQPSVDALSSLLQSNDNDIVFLTDNFGNVLYTNYKNSDVKFYPENTEKKFLHMDGNEFYYSFYTSKEHNLILYNLNPINSYSSIYLVVFVVTIFIGVFLFFLLQMLANRMVVQNSKSIDNLLESIRKIQAGDYNLDLKIESDDEFQMLANQYKNLVDQISTLLKNNEELSKLKHNSEMKLLSAQFSPHFMLNILETLRYSLYIDLDISHQIINMLSNQLKYTLYNLQENRLLADDLNYIEEYIRLHQIRFDSRISYEIKIPDKLKNAIVPKLILQPIIENSIKYGFRYQDNLKISISIFLKKKDLFVEITDDGKGLTHKEYLFVKNLLKSESWPDSHIGLYGINKRLVLLYGEKYHLEIINREGESFTVRLRMPYITEES